MTRLLLILALVIQPLLAIGGLGPCGIEQVASRTTQVCCCGPDSCCAAGETPSCGCAVDSAPDSDRQEPATPRSIDSQTVLLALVLATVKVQAAPVNPAPALVDDTPSHTTHNQRQALLCTWRT